jgi:hypothetical protein
MVGLLATEMLLHCLCLAICLHLTPHTAISTMSFFRDQRNGRQCQESKLLYQFRGYGYTAAAFGSPCLYGHGQARAATHGYLADFPRYLKTCCWNPPRYCRDDSTTIPLVWQSPGYLLCMNKPSIDSELPSDVAFVSALPATLTYAT